MLVIKTIFSHKAANHIIFTNEISCKFYSLENLKDFYSVSGAKSQIMKFF